MNEQSRPCPRLHRRRLRVLPARFPLLVVLAGLLLSFARGMAAPVPYAPDDIVSPARQIDPAKLPAPWDTLVADLRKKTSIWAEFTENRYLPFKKIPVVFTGEMRFSAAHGLSLHYTRPEERLVIMDTRGLILRDGAGHSRELSMDPRALAATTTLLDVMRFDMGALAASFNTYAAGDRSLWHLAFEPRDDAVAKNLSRIVVSGEGDQVRRIQLRKSSMQSVEILIGDVRDGVTFTPEDLRRFFR